jgi:hypothetical protein
MCNLKPQAYAVVPEQRAENAAPAQAADPIRLSQRDAAPPGSARSPAHLADGGWREPIGAECAQHVRVKPRKSVEQAVNLVLEIEAASDVLDQLEPDLRSIKTAYPLDVSLAPQPAQLSCPALL